MTSTKDLRLKTGVLVRGGLSAAISIMEAGSEFKLCFRNALI